MALLPLICSLALLQGCLARPAQNALLQDTADAAPAEVTPTRTISTSGNLYGPTSIRGFFPGEPLSTEDTTIPEDEIDFAQFQASDTIGAILNLETVAVPQPIRGTEGGTEPGPRQIDIQRAHPDVLAPPGTDKGDVAQFQWPLDLSHIKYGSNRAGWSRQQNSEQLPASLDFAGVDMRLEAGAYRELHWHTANEWALVLNGSARIGAMDEASETFYDDVSKGDVWFFPSGVPHYIQALDNGTEFLLVFDSGDFSEDDTFLVSEMFARTPKEVWSKDMDLPVDAFKNIPESALFIFNGTVPPKNIAEQNVTGAAGPIPNEFTYSYHWSLQEPFEAPGGTVKIIDTTTFPIAQDFSAALVTIHPGGMREVHWHPQSDEWDFFIQGKARNTIFAANDNSRTFDYLPGDTGYVPKSFSHYIENIGNEDVIFLEVLKQPKYTDISVAQWLALTPSKVVEEHLGFTDETIENLSKDKAIIVQGKVPPGQGGLDVETGI